MRGREEDEDRPTRCVERVWLALTLGRGTGEVQGSSDGAFQSEAANVGRRDWAQGPIRRCRRDPLTMFGPFWDLLPLFVEPS